MARLSAEQAGGQNVIAFLDMIAHAEGVERFSEHSGYDVMVGGKTFTSYDEHPRKLAWLPKYRINSTAAGRYQFLWKTWNSLRNRLRLPDFGPASQDRAAIDCCARTVRSPTSRKAGSAVRCANRARRGLRCPTLATASARCRWKRCWRSIRKPEVRSHDRT